MIGIVGLGLIGGSLGLDLRACGFEVVGVSRSPITCRTATVKGAVDRASTDLAILATAEIVFICTPLAAIIPTVQQIVPHLAADAVVTDVGSVKTLVVEACSSLWPQFIGGHPMAGTAEQGIEAAQPNLFRHAPYVLTPIDQTSTAALERVGSVARLLGVNLYTCSPQVHDGVVASISHLPVMVSASLIDACMQTNAEVLPLAQQLASSGFRDTSRVGGGNWELGVMMARYNRTQLLRSLRQYRQSLDQIVELVEREDWQSLEQVLKTAQQARPQFLR